MRVGLAWTVACVAVVACRGGFDETTPGLVPMDGVSGVRLSEPGSLVIEDGKYDVAPAVGTAGGYAVGWVEYAAGDRTPRISFAVVAENGSFVVAPRVVELFTTLPGYLRLWSGRDGYLMVFSTGGDEVFVVLDAAGTVRARREDSAAYAQFEFVAVDSGYVGVFARVVTGGTEYSIHALRLDADANEVGTAVPIELQPTAQEDPAIAVSGTGFGVTWVDLRTGDPRLRFARLDANGEPAGPSVAIREDGRDQGLPLIVPDGQDGFAIVYDGYSTFPLELLRIGADGAPLWPAPAVIYDEPHYHDTVDVAGTGGRAGFAWITEASTLLTNVQFTAVDAGVAAAPAVPAPVLVTDPRYSFCYPEVARGLGSFGTAFAGEVEGSLALFLVIVED